MRDIQTVIVQLASVGMGTVTEGHFKVEGGVLIMTFADGTPVDDSLFRHRLKDGDNPRAIAGVLTRKVRLHVKGMTETEDTFSRPLSYANQGYA